MKKIFSDQYSSVCVLIHLHVQLPLLPRSQGALLAAPSAGTPGEPCSAAAIAWGCIPAHVGPDGCRGRGRGCGRDQSAPEEIKTSNFNENKKVFHWCPTMTRIEQTNIYSTEWYVCIFLAQDDVCKFSVVCSSDTSKMRQKFNRPKFLPTKIPQTAVSLIQYMY